MAAISAIHETRGHCIAMPEEDRHKGCYQHVGWLHVWHTGDPQTPKHQTMKNNADYKPNGDSPLMPWELLAMHKLCISQNDIGHLQFWTMTFYMKKFQVC